MEVTFDCLVSSADDSQDWLFRFNDKDVNEYILDTLSHASLHFMVGRVNVKLEADHPDFSLHNLTSIT